MRLHSYRLPARYAMSLPQTHEINCALGPPPPQRSARPPLWPSWENGHDRWLGRHMRRVAAVAKLWSGIDGRPAKPLVHLPISGRGLDPQDFHRKTKFSTDLRG